MLFTAHALGAIPSPRAFALCFVQRLRAAALSGIMVPARGLELPHRGHARHDGQIALAADLGGRAPARVANNAKMSGLDHGERHHPRVRNR
jgi:hypothetical protein